MLHALSWFVVFVLLALWSLAAWGFHALAAWTIANSAGLKGGAGEALSLQVPDWFAPWLPPEWTSALPAVLPVLTSSVEFLLELAPEFAAVLSVAVWAVWGVGSVLLLVLGIVSSGVITVLRRRRSAKSGPSIAAHSYG